MKFVLIMFMFNIPMFFEPTSLDKCNHSREMFIELGLEGMTQPPLCVSLLAANKLKEDWR